ncbi:hypothetical protein Trydic_g13431 [Trypoxylus dichotomus]
MNALLDLTLYDKRRSKGKELKFESKQIPGNIQPEKLKGKSKSLNRIDRINKATRIEKVKKENAKSRDNLLTLHNSQYGSIISLAGDNPKKETKPKINVDNNKCKISEIDPAQLRPKSTRNDTAPPARTDNVIQDAINGFNYSGSIELKFEEALEVCSDNFYDEIDEEFGRNLFDDETDNYILEAYNKPGDELVETFIEVEHRTRYLPPENEQTPSNSQSKRRSDEQKDRTLKQEDLCLISDEEECVFLEAFNSRGYELRKTYSLIDKSLSNIALDQDFQSRTLSITSDVQEYFNELEDKCESEDPRQPAPKTYINYGKIIEEYQRSTYAASLQELSDSNSGPSAVGAGECHNTEPPQVPSVNVFANYNRMVDEFRKSQHAKVASENMTSRKVNEVKKVKNDSDGESESSEDQVYEVSTPTPEAIKFNPLIKSDFIIHELLETELVYIKNLKKILTDYLSYFRKFPPLSQSNVDIIFGNIQDIYYQTVEFYRALLMCSNDYEAIGLTFIDYKNLFKLYPIYMKNKPKADRILIQNYKSVIEDRQKKLRDRLDLMSYLLNPIQRLGRYILLLENLQKSVRRSACLDPAIEILKTNMTKGNDSIAVESILRIPETLDLYRKGSYIDREKFMMIKPRRQEIVLFLFEGIVVLTTENITSRRDVHNTFTYSTSIEMNDLSIAIVDGDLQTFQLIDYPKCKRNKEDGVYIFEAKDKKTRDNWGELIKGRLWAQLKKYKDQSKSYKPVNRTNSTSSAKLHQYMGDTTSQNSASTSVSRENSTRSKGGTSSDKRTEKAGDKYKRRAKKPKSDAAKRTSKFYTDSNNLHYNKTM